MAKCRHIKQICFESELVDYTEDFKFRVFAVDPITKKINSLEQVLKLTEVYDQKGYMHRYVLKEMVEKALVNFE